MQYLTGREKNQAAIKLNYCRVINGIEFRVKESIEINDKLNIKKYKMRSVMIL